MSISRDLRGANVNNPTQLPPLPPGQSSSSSGIRIKLVNKQNNASSAVVGAAPSPGPSASQGYPQQPAAYSPAGFQNEYPHIQQPYQPYPHQQQPYDMARLSTGRNAAPSADYSDTGRPSRNRKVPDYNDNKPLEYQQPPTVQTGFRPTRSSSSNNQQPNWADTAIPSPPVQTDSRRRTIPQSGSSSNLGGYGQARGGVKNEEREQDYQEEEEDADGSYDDSGEYSASGRSKRGAVGKGKSNGRGGGPAGGGKGKGRAVAASKSKKRNSYGNDDDEDDFVAEDDEEEVEEEVDDTVHVSNYAATSTRSARLQSQPTSKAQAQPVYVHPNFNQPSSSDEEEEEDDEDVPIAVQAQLPAYSRPARAGAPQSFQGTQVVPDSEPDVRYVSSSTQLNLGPNGQIPLGALFDDDAPVMAAARNAAGNIVRRKINTLPSEEDEEDEEQDAEGETELASEGYPVVASSESKKRRQQQQQPYLAAVPVKVEAYKTSSGRNTIRKTIVESEGSGDDLAVKPNKRAQSQSSRRYAGEGSGSDDDFQDDGEEEYTGRRQTRGNTRKAIRSKAARFAVPRRTTRNSRRGGGGGEDEDEDYEDNSRKRRESSTASDEDDILLTLTDAESQDELMLQAQGRVGKDGRNYRLRKRSDVNYNVPAMFGLNPDGTPATNADGTSKSGEGKKDKPKKKKTGYGGPKHLPFNMSGRQLGNLFGEAPDSSSDDDVNTPRRPSGMLGSAGTLSAGSLPMDFNSGTPNNLGKVSGATNLADIDPLLPSTQLSFDSVGGLQSHIQQLKEMVSLPLLYPEVFQRFGITPPRGVLFHGPPGTGKTLMARALAASCSSQGQKISFFMRKGADVLSKWVGEAERQLRLLFEEAKNSQPSIIFFDEIDGLAPVRSSKQDQIHASIVSTLLALMDGMDGRGQVIVIGATNRPDAVDPALRRPGRFDREFYFPLPDLEARRKIIEINTKKWEPPMRAEFLDELAHITKGYGGADLRALCTEAALNAVQRKYPQIYQTSDRLLIKPEEIDVIARDFIISAKNLIPSTARSTSTLASPLPVHLEPLLRDNLNKAIASLTKILPEVKKINILEEAQFEPLGDGGFEQERLMQTFENLRVFRPRLLIAGKQGLGQNFVGSAVLQHLEGFHVQSLDLATLVGDSARTAEAACVQIFTEAKRHKPSIIYIPSLVGWSNAVGDSTKSTIRGLLDSLDPSDPILLLAIAEAPFSEISSDVKSWFGFLRNNRVTLEMPTTDQRDFFFAETLSSIARKPTDYPDAMPRKKRILEELPIAPPPAPREPTAGELEQQAQNDARLREYLKFRLGPIVLELKKRFKKFSKPIGDGEEIEILQRPPGPAAQGGHEEQDGEGEEVVFVSTKQAPSVPSEQLNGMAVRVPSVNGHAEDHEMEGTEETAPVASTSALPYTEAGPSNGTTGEAATAGPSTSADVTNAPAVTQPTSITFRFHEISLDKIESRLYSDKYHTPESLLADVERIVENAYHEGEPDTLSKADQMLNNARIMVDQACDAGFRIECSRMGQREKERAKQRQEKRQKAREEREKQAATEKEGQVDTATTGSTGEQTGTNGLKRPREEGQDGDEAAKRVRMDGNDIEMREAATNRNTLINGQSNLAGRVLPIPESPSPLVSANTAVVNGNATSASLSIAGPVPFPSSRTISAASSALSSLPACFPASPSSSFTTIQPDSSSSGKMPLGQPIASTSASAAATALAKSPSPEPEPLPPFILPSDSLSSLGHFLKNHTAGLSVDELEQLRAAGYDCIWRARRDWNKTGLIEEIREMAEEFIQEVEESRRED